MSSSLLTWIFFKFLAFFRCVLVVSYLQIQQKKYIWIIGILINHFFAIFKVSRPETLETVTRPKTFETGTRKNGSWDESRDRDQVSSLHHCLFQSSLSLYWLKWHFTQEFCRDGRSNIFRLRSRSYSKFFESESGPKVFQIWECDSCSDSGYHRCNWNPTMFFLKRWHV